MIIYLFVHTPSYATHNLLSLLSPHIHNTFYSFDFTTYLCIHLHLCGTWQVLMEQAGFEVLEQGQWGNLLYEQHVLSTHTWAGKLSVTM